MQENNFEKSVQQNLDGLHITPSEPVWQKIEATIKKRRQRRLVLWMLPLLLVTGALGLWMATTQREETTAKAVEKIETAPTFSKPHTGNAAKPLEIRKDSEDSKVQPEMRPAIAKAKLKKTQEHKQRSKHAFPQHKNTDSSNLIFAESVHPVAKEKSDKILGKIHEINPIHHSDNVVSGSVSPVLALNAPAMVPPIDAATSPVVIDINNIPKISKPASKPNGNPKWQWFIASRIGASNISEKFFSLPVDKSNAEALEFSAPPAMSNDAQAGRIASESASLYTNGVQFSIGGGVKKAIGKRSFLVAGLQYSFYRNQVTAAPQLPSDSIARSVYNYALGMYGYGRIRSQFTNTLYFIELPLGLEHQLLKNRRLHVQYGAAISRLTSGKALRYDKDKNIYYQDDMALRKTGLSLYTIVDYTLWKGRGITFNAGPQLQYGVSNSFKNTSDKSHLVSAGIAVTMGF